MYGICAAALGTKWRLTHVLSKMLASPVDRRSGLPHVQSCLLELLLPPPLVVKLTYRPSNLFLKAAFV